MRVGAVDCGTNSIRLLVADIDDGVKTDLVRELQIVRLGHDVDRTGRLDGAALRRTFAACDDYAGVLRDRAVEAVRFCATSATRDADNADAFAAGIVERFGVAPDVLSGDEEAALSFAGACRELPDADDPVLVVDLGGGSTELILGRGKEVVAAQSLDVGSVRMTERHLHDDPATAVQVQRCVADVDTVLETSRVDLAAARTVVGVAGTVTTIAAHTLDLTAYQPDSIHLARLPVDELRRSCAAVLAASVVERRAMAFMHPGRADVIGGGAIVLDQILTRLGVDEMVVSERDILDGIAWSLT